MAVVHWEFMPTWWHYLTWIGTYWWSRATWNRWHDFSFAAAACQWRQQHVLAWWAFLITVAEVCALVATWELFTTVVEAFVEV